MNKIKVVLLDDHQMFRDGLKAVISDEKNIELIGAVGSAKELYQLLETKNPDLLITDITMPDISGIEVTAYINENYPNTKVLILSMHSSEEFIVKALNAGAKGYLPKETGTDELLEAINAIHKGNCHFNKNISDTILNSLVSRTKQQTQLADLTKREIEILKLVVEGLTNKEIAEQLFISIRTVDSHKNNLMTKLNLKSSVELVKFAIKNKLVTLK
jgi:DNA-binding NarL/FixJ family response regulator